jgi:spore coat protein A, manganese oxidase
MPSRRDFFRAGGLAGAGLFLSRSIPALSVDHTPVMPTTRRLPVGAAPLRRFIDPLPKPRVLAPLTHEAGVPVYRIAASEFAQQLHSDLPPTPLWGYDGSFPGPTIEARHDAPLRVIWANELGTGTHLLPVDRTLHGTDMGEPDRRMVTHLHGGIVPPEADGYPEDWFTTGYEDSYLYPNSQRAATLWYHDHALGITRLNVQAGLAAFYLLRDDEEDALIAQGLPAGDFEVPIAIQDRSFHADGSLFYPADGITPEHPVWQPEFFGDVPVINGVAYPVLNVEPRRYRLRLLNGCNARFLNMQLFQYANGRYRGNGPAFVMIGNDGGLLAAPATISQDPGGRVPRRLLLAPAERADIIVDFSGFAGDDLILHNNAPTPFSGFVQGNARPPVHRPGHPIGADLPELMLFRVARRAVTDDSVIPTLLSPSFESLDAGAATVVREITLDEVLDAHGMPLEALLQGQHWRDPITEQRAFGSTEIWNLINLTADSHPIHLHLDHFQVLGRQAFNAPRFMRGQSPQLRGRPRRRSRKSAAGRTRWWRTPARSRRSWCDRTATPASIRTTATSSSTRTTR